MAGPARTGYSAIDHAWRSPSPPTVEKPLAILPPFHHLPRMADLINWLGRAGIDWTRKGNKWPDFYPMWTRSGHLVCNDLEKQPLDHAISRPVVNRHDCDHEG